MHKLTRIQSALHLSYRTELICQKIFVTNCFSCIFCDCSINGQYDESVTPRWFQGHFHTSSTRLSTEIVDNICWAVRERLPPTGSPRQAFLDKFEETFLVASAPTEFLQIPISAHSSTDGADSGITDEMIPFAGKNLDHLEQREYFDSDNSCKVEIMANCQ